MVTDENRLAWEEYSVANTGWLAEGYEYQAEKGIGVEEGSGAVDKNPYISQQIVSFDESGGVIADPGVSIETATNVKDNGNLKLT